MSDFDQDTLSYWSKRRRDKCGRYSRERRFEKGLLRQGLKSKSILVASLTLPNQTSQGKGALSIYRDAIVRVRRRQRRPDCFNKPEEVGDA